MVTTPICNFCAQTGMLCQSCQDKLNGGIVDEKDIELAKQLIKLEPQFPSLKDVNISKIINFADFKILIVEKGCISGIIGPKGKILKNLEKTINKKIRVIEKGSSYMKIIEDLLSPIRVLGINKVFLPTGDMIQKVILKKPRGLNINVDTVQLENLVYSLTGNTVRLSFE
ncbi:MAG: hypothetical protein QW739_03875 [Candidatus Odinarchaeota archaeon]